MPKSTDGIRGDTGMDFHGIGLKKDEIARFCRRHQIRKLALFGSILRDDFSPATDIDVLVEFAKGHAPGFLGMAALERELSEPLGHRVELRTAAELSRYFRDEVVREGAVQYTEA